MPRLLLAAPFAMLLWCKRAGVAREEMRAFWRSRLEEGCRYAVCGGRDCEAWHDEADAAYLELYGTDVDVADPRFTITTWHTGESPKRVLFYFVGCEHPTIPLAGSAVLIVGGNAADARRWCERIETTAECPD